MDSTYNVFTQHECAHLSPIPNSFKAKTFTFQQKCAEPWNSYIRHIRLNWRTKSYWLQKDLMPKPCNSSKGNTWKTFRINIWTFLGFIHTRGKVFVSIPILVGPPCGIFLDSRRKLDPSIQAKPDQSLFRSFATSRCACA